MPKPKLSKDDRKALRAQIQSMLRKGSPKAEILKKVAAKYSVSPESVRWHMKKLGTPAGRPGRPPKEAPPQAARNLAAAVRHAANGISNAILKNALKAKSLLGKLETQLRARERLAKAQAQAARALRAAESQAHRLRKKIASLISG